MRFTLRYKLFTATMLLSTALVLLLIGSLWLTLGQSFTRYASANELTRLDWLVARLESGYAANGGWTFLKSDGDRLWRSLVQPPGLPGLPPPPGQQPQEPWPPKGPNPDADQRPLPPPPREALPMGGPAREMVPPGPLQTRLGLTDPEGHPIAGNPQSNGGAATRPLRFQGRVIGQLSLQAMPADLNELNASFLATQGRNMLVVGVAAILLSLLVSWLLTRQLVRPIADLNDSARHIADGRLETRIAIRSNDELGDLARNFNAMADELAKTEQVRRAWISDASHELRTPLAILQAEIEAIEDHVREPDAATLARLHKQVRQLTTLVDDLRQTLDSNLGVDRIERLPINPLTLLADSVESFSDRFQTAGLGLEISGNPDNTVRLNGDARRLTQIFTNLLENSLRYTKSGGLLRITIALEQHWLTLRFDDSEPAPPDWAMEQLFNRFFRVEPSRSRALGGSGLGLAICKTLVEAHDGKIAARRSELGGLCITVSLPVERP